MPLKCSIYACNDDFWMHSPLLCVSFVATYCVVYFCYVFFWSLCHKYMLFCLKIWWFFRFKQTAELLLFSIPYIWQLEFIIMVNTRCTECGLILYNREKCFASFWCFTLCRPPLHFYMRSAQIVQIRVRTHTHSGTMATFKPRCSQNSFRVCASMYIKSDIRLIA